MATDHKSEPYVGNVQQPLAPQDLRGETDQNQGVPPVTEIVSGWPAVAYDLSPRYAWVFTGALLEAVRTGAHSKNQIEQIIRGHCLDCPLSWEVLDEILTDITRYFHLVTKHKVSIEDFLRNLSPGRRPKVVYEAFHHGQPHIYCDELPPEVLNLKKTALFWIYRSANELLSLGKPRERSEWLPPRAEEMLHFLCRAKNAGQIILFSDLYREVWKRAVLPGQKPPYGSIDEAENWINTFVATAERFIISAPDASKSADKKVLRIRGANKFKIGKKVSADLVIIKGITP